MLESLDMSGMTMNQLGTLIEEFRSEVRVYYENTRNVPEDIRELKNKMYAVEERLSVVEYVVRQNSEDISSLKHSTKNLETITGRIETKLDRHENRFLKLEKKLA